MKRRNLRDNYAQFQDATASGQLNLFLFFLKNRARYAACFFPNQQYLVALCGYVSVIEIGYSVSYICVLQLPHSAKVS